MPAPDRESKSGRPADAAVECRLRISEPGGVYRSRANCAANFYPRHSSRSGRRPAHQSRPDRYSSRLRAGPGSFAAAGQSVVPPVGLERAGLLPYLDRSQHRPGDRPAGPEMPPDPGKRVTVSPATAGAGPADRHAPRPAERLDPARGSPAARAGEAPAGPSANAERACHTSRPPGR